MSNIKISKLLLAWLTTQGHMVVEYDEGRGMCSLYAKTDRYRFDIDGSYGGYRVEYSSGVFSFYEGDELVKQSNLNEFQ